MSDPIERPCPSVQTYPTEQALEDALNRMILSPSGWRGIFSADGDEENTGEEPAPAYCYIAAAAAAVFAEYLHARSISWGREATNWEGIVPTAVFLGRDTRPTGKIITDIMIRAFLASGCTVRFLGITAAPEIMAFSRTAFGGAPQEPPKLQEPSQLLMPRGGFCYISASHNPIGHNGLKFGLDNGGVLEGSEAIKLIEAFKKYMALRDPVGRLRALLEKADEKTVRQVYAESEKNKKEALAAYRSFTKKVIAGEGPNAEAVMQAMADGLRKFPLGIAVDFNGSARTASIDEELFHSLGIGFHKINGKPGEIAHAIIPEGNALESCRSFLEDLHKKDPSIILGYMPDCDGDRGNLVVWDESRGEARTLDAQEVFALACVGELAHLVWTGKLVYDEKEHWVTKDKYATKTAIVVNGPTSRRIDRIAEAFGVEVFRAEVGEANVVKLAEQLRGKGYKVRILGEGSNGGNITHPSSVRDPLSTIFALVKLLTIRSGGTRNTGLFDIWREAARNAGIAAAAGITGADGKTGNAFTLADILASLPQVFTTATSAPESKLPVTTNDPALLKRRYQNIFEKEWDEKKDELRRRWGFTRWEARACIGTEELRNLSDFGGAQSGGLKIVFMAGTPEKESAFIWMRGSKTEPVFRIMADAEDPALERELIAWQRAMTAAADKEQRN